ncbi:MAG: hypothetical protein AAF993_19150 [Pseudomonadota bacterium]
MIEELVQLTRTAMTSERLEFQVELQSFDNAKEVLMSVQMPLNYTGVLHQLPGYKSGNDQIGLKNAELGVRLVSGLADSVSEETDGTKRKILFKLGGSVS